MILGDDTINVWSLDWWIIGLSNIGIIIANRFIKSFPIGFYDIYVNHGSPLLMIVFLIIIPNTLGNPRTHHQPQGWIEHCSSELGV